MPEVACDAIDRLFGRTSGPYDYRSLTHHFGVQSAVTALAAFRSEFEHLIRDATVIARRQSERAFEHLNRSLVADPTIAARWRTALKKGETACERLGAAHLLSHGIWAFKVNEAGERTDLVFPERRVEEDEVARVADAFVLTEWKLVRAPATLDRQLRHARDQADQYTRGVLGGIELARYGYLVMVSEDSLAMEKDLPSETSETTVYRCINIAVKPRVPSRR